MRQFFFAVMMSAVVFVPSEARSQASEPEASAPNPKHAAAFERAYRLKEQGKEAQALAAFNAILAKDPNNRIATMEAGYLHASLKHYGSAVKLLAAASAQDPQNMQLHMDLGYTYQAMKRHELAQERFRLVASKPGELQAAGQTAAADAGLALAGEAQEEAVVGDALVLEAAAHVEVQAAADEEPGDVVERVAVALAEFVGPDDRRVVQ